MAAGVARRHWPQPCTTFAAATIRAVSILAAGCSLLAALPALPAFSASAPPRTLQLFAVRDSSSQGFTGASAPARLRGLSAAVPAREGGTQVGLFAGVGWVPSLPQGCEDDYECNDGRANFPLQCCEVPFLGKFCCEPGDGMAVSQNPAFVPLPVPVEDAFGEH
uniref:Uncharacterized protein n=1 Tax=Pyrodinium bahamense TaxID=73915 RepID=A0A7S0FXX4_9DINO